MGTILTILGIVLSIVGIVCSIIILIHAFKNEVWKGIVGLLCGLYLIYYMFTEFEHEKKGLIILGSLGGGILGAILRVAGMAMSGGLPTAQ